MVSMVPEITNAAPIPGRDPLTMLKNNEPIPPNGIYLHVVADPDGKAAKIDICRGKMLWEKYSGEVSLGFEKVDNTNPSSVHAVYTASDYPHRNKQPYDRPGAAYDGLRSNDFEGAQLSEGEVAVTREPIDMTNHHLTHRVVLDLIDPGEVKAIIRIFELGDIDGAVNAVKMSMQLIGLPIPDSAKIADLLLKKLAPGT